jgi:hypothetical protein
MIPSKFQRSFVFITGEDRHHHAEYRRPGPKAMMLHKVTSHTGWNILRYFSHIIALMWQIVKAPGAEKR